MPGKTAPQAKAARFTAECAIDGCGASVADMPEQRSRRWTPLSLCNRFGRRRRTPGYRVRLFGGGERRRGLLVAPQMQVQHPLDPRKPLALLAQDAVNAVDPGVD